uniref:Secreted protein n=1 Tax=Micrurus surinamensis TaxID=129470 RepID=A0A2D4NW09_MICSU
MEERSQLACFFLLTEVPSSLAVLTCNHLTRTADPSQQKGVRCEPAVFLKRNSGRQCSSVTSLQFLSLRAAFLLVSVKNLGCARPGKAKLTPEARQWEGWTSVGSFSWLVLLADKTITAG